MAECVLKDGAIVKDYGTPYFVAEVNSSHNGNIDAAKQMIDAAVAAGCSCVKFQSWSASSLYSRSYYQKNPMAKRFVDKFSLTPEQLKILAQYCRSCGIAFSSTPYSEDEVDFLAEECEAPFIKIASMELNNLPYLRYIGKKKLPVVLSTGMGEMEEIEKAVNALESVGNKEIVLLHCVSIYPAKTESIHLNNIVGLRERFPDYPIGFSDHTLGDAAAVAATALGAALIEKHLTLDAKKIGMDNQMAMEPEALTHLVIKCKEVHQALGSKERVVSEAEYKQRENMRRSVVSARDLSAGSILQAEDLYVKRPGTGVPPDRLESLLGKKLNKDIEADMLILETDVE